MKLFYVFFFCCTAAVAQSTPQELAERVFKATADNDVTAFKQNYPDLAALTFFMKSIKTTDVYTDAMMKEASIAGTNTLAARFNILQQVIKTLVINFKAATVTNTLVEDNEVRINEDQSGEELVFKTKKITLQFTTGGKNYSLIIPHTVQIKDRWYITDDPIQLITL